jgi:nicotinamidase-related amidase
MKLRCLYFLEMRRDRSSITRRFLVPPWISRIVFALAFISLMGVGCAGKNEAVVESLQDTAGPSAKMDSQPTTEGNQKQPITLGVVVIDVQKSFVANAATNNMDGILQRVAQLMTLSTSKKLPFFITYEDSKKGNSALAPTLVPVQPQQRKEFIKTTFAATGQPDFKKSVQSSGVSHFIVAGAETDVCVLQTVHGLLDMGCSVFLMEDAVFTSEPNTGPAIKRMIQSGAILSTVDRLETALEKNELEALQNDSSIPSRTKASIIDPQGVAVVVADLQQAFIDEASSKNKEAKLARVNELFILSDWLQIPFFMTFDSSLNQTVPSRFTEVKPPQTKMVVHEPDSVPNGLLTALKNAEVSQVIVAGVEARASVGQTARDLQIAGFEVFLMEDAVLFSNSTDGSEPDTLYQEGIVPTTYKAFYYDMLRSMNPAEWISPIWLKRAEEKFDYLMTYPEDLPPIS